LSLDLNGFRDVLGRRGMIKSMLMNQKRIAGIGNIYFDEILYLAGIHPRKDVRSLTKDQTRELHRDMRHVLSTAIKKRADANDMPKSWLLPLRGAEGTCPRCGGIIKSLNIAGRTAWYCPSHQMI
jgi:formamidopyrimidine-DNA glycosylase